MKIAYILRIVKLYQHINIHTACTMHQTWLNHLNSFDVMTTLEVTPFSKLKDSSLGSRAKRSNDFMRARTTREFLALSDGRPMRTLRNWAGKFALTLGNINIWHIIVALNNWNIFMFFPLPLNITQWFSGLFHFLADLNGPAISSNGVSPRLLSLCHGGAQELDLQMVQNVLPTPVPSCQHHAII